jgi:hypothetical protein
MLLLQLAEESGLRDRIDDMYRGEKINITENRAVLHVALRAPKGTSIIVDGESVVPQVHSVLGKMTDFSNRSRNGAWTGHTGMRPSGLYRSPNNRTEQAVFVCHNCGLTENADTNAANVIKWRGIEMLRAGEITVKKKKHAMRLKKKHH